MDRSMLTESFKKYHTELMDRSMSTNIKVLTSFTALEIK